MSKSCYISKKVHIYTYEKKLDFNCSISMWFWQNILVNSNHKDNNYESIQKTRKKVLPMKIELFVYSKPLYFFEKKNIMTMQVMCKNATFTKKGS